MDKFTNVLCLLTLAVVAIPSSVRSAIDPACPLSGVLPPADVLVGYIGNPRQTNGTRVGSFRVLAKIRDGALLIADGGVIRDGMKYWEILTPSAAPATLKHASSLLDRLGKDHCVYHAEPGRALTEWALLSSRPLPGIFRPPDPSETTWFAEQHDTCVDQGDYQPADKPPCSRPRLLAVSDLKQDGEQHYWATEPYSWDTGITVWRRTEGGLVRVMNVCSGCSG